MNAELPEVAEKDSDCYNYDNDEPDGLSFEYRHSADAFLPIGVLGAVTRAVQFA